MRRRPTFRDRPHDPLGSVPRTRFARFGRAFERLLKTKQVISYNGAISRKGFLLSGSLAQRASRPPVNGLQTLINRIESLVVSLCQSKRGISSRYETGNLLI